MNLNDERIRHLLGSGERNSRVLVVGLGSGGFPVVQHLAMSGWKQFVLVDPDRLDLPNLVKHPGLRSDESRYKVDVARDWILDRNPDCDVSTIKSYFEEIEPLDLDRLLSECDLVVSATDLNGIRHLINDLCIEHAVPMVVGMVHRGGVGGTVMAYRPGRSGCYRCLEIVAENLDGLPNDNEFPRTELEDKMNYGRGNSTFAAAGLSADIAFIAALHAQVILSELLVLEGAKSTPVPPLSGTWMAVDMRSSDGWNWTVNQIDLPQIDNCSSCGQGVDQAEVSTHEHT